MAALQSVACVTVHHTPGIGHAFLKSVSTPSVISPNPQLDKKGLVILPEDDVSPEAYAPLARALALHGCYSVVVEKPCAGRTVRAMMQRPLLENWTLAGHGLGGGTLAAQLALTLQPKVKALILMAAPMPQDVNMANLNIFVVALYGQKDSVVTPETVEESFSRMPGDSDVTSFPNLGHYDFAKSECVGNEKLGQLQGQGLTDQDFNSIVMKALLAVVLSRWLGASEKALSFSDNQKLTPGRNDSKVYPGDIRVQYTAIPMPNTSPQRFWWVFTPTEIKGGLVYYPGATVDSRAYFPLAFEIAARGHLVVIVQMPMRISSSNYQDANAVIDSDHPLLSVVPKGKWALAGHSDGGKAASLYAAEFGDRIYAAVMHAGKWEVDMTKNPFPMAQIYGTLDDVSPGGYDRYRYKYTDPPPKGTGPLVNLETTRFVPIEGANHCQVGDYGYQSPDQISTLSMEQQVAQFAIETVSFLEDVASGNPIPSRRPH